MNSADTSYDNFFTKITALISPEERELKDLIEVSSLINPDNSSQFSGVGLANGF